MLSREESELAPDVFLVLLFTSDMIDYILTILVGAENEPDEITGIFSDPAEARSFAQRTGSEILSFKLAGEPVQEPLARQQQLTLSQTEPRTPSQRQ